MRLLDLTQRTKHASIAIDTELLNFDYYHQLVTPALIATLNDLKKTSDYAGISKSLVTLIASWDLLDADGTPFPLDLDRLQNEVPVLFQAQVLHEIVTGIFQGEVAATQLVS